MTQFNLIKQAFFALLILGLFVGIYYLQEIFASKEIVKIQQSLNVPVRYAFISDEKTTKLAILDTYTNEVVNNVDLKQIPNELYIDKIQGVLFYTTSASDNLYSFDLKTYQQKEILFPSSIKQMGFIPDSDYIIIATDKELAIYKLSEQLEKVRIIATYQSPIIFNLTTDGAYLVVSELKTGRLVRYSVRQDDALVIADLEQSISGAAVSPDSQKVAIVDDSTNQLKVYQLMDATVLLSLSLDGHATRPYISADSKTLMVATINGTFYKVNLDTNQVDHLEIGAKALDLKTGWIEQNIVLVAKDNLLNLQLEPLKLNSKERLSIQSFLVTSDSKTLIGTQKARNRLIIYSIRDESVEVVKLKALTSANKVIMGQTNTLCH